MPGITHSQRPIASAKKARRKRKSHGDADSAPDGSDSHPPEGDDISAAAPSHDAATTPDWWAEVRLPPFPFPFPLPANPQQIIHHHTTLLTAHLRLLRALLRSTPPASPRHAALAAFVARTHALLQQTRDVAVEEAAPAGRERRRSDAAGAAAGSAKRKRWMEMEGLGTGETEVAGPPSSPLPIREAKKVRRGEEGEAPRTPGEGRVQGGVEREDITAEVEERLRAKERAKAKIKEGGNGRKRRRRSSTVEAEERRREKRVKRESGGGAGAKRSSLGGEEGRGAREGGRKRSRTVT